VDVLDLKLREKTNKNINLHKFIRNTKRSIINGHMFSTFMNYKKKIKHNIQGYNTLFQNEFKKIV
jgi:hypothetical protein